MKVVLYLLGIALAAYLGHSHADRLLSQQPPLGQEESADESDPPPAGDALADDPSPPDDTDAATSAAPDPSPAPTTDQTPPKP